MPFIGKGSAGTPGLQGPKGDKGDTGATPDMSWYNSSINTLESKTSTLEAKAGVIAIGVGSIPAIVLNGSAVVQVTIKPTMADTNFTATAVLVGVGSLLANLTIQTITTVNATRVDVTVKNNGVASLGGTVLVIAVHN